MRRISILLAIICLSTIFSGCRTVSSDGPADPLAVAPPDFSIDLTVMTGENVEPGGATSMRAGRVVLFSDGTLKYAPEAPQGTSTLPPTVRRLSVADLAEVFTRLQKNGFADPFYADDMKNIDLLEPNSNRRMYVLAVTGNSKRWIFVRDADADRSPDPAMVDLTAYLTDLAWAFESEVSTKQPPKRYDFGPDPYARYRSP